MNHHTGKKLLLVLASIGFSICILNCQSQKITILHTNDMHGAFLPHEAGWVKAEQKPMVGGFLELNRMIDSIRSVQKNSLILDGGDVMTGNPIAEMKYKEAFGGALFEMMNMIGYEAWAIGNHDLDISQENFKRLSQIAKFPTLSANLVDSAGNHPLNNKEYLILNKDGIRVGLIGIMSERLFELTNTKSLAGLKVLPVTDLLQKIIDKIDPETDLIIAITHQGFDADSILATNIKNLDVIMGSHSHTRLKSPKSVNGILIVQTGSYCENLGELNLTVSDDKIVSSEGRLHTLWAQPDYKETELSKLVGEFRLKVDRDFNEVIGKTDFDLKRSRGSESAIGHFIADAIREETGADFALTNSSGIRKDIMAGDIRKMDLFEVAPFRNYLSTFPLKGSEVRQLIGRYLKSLSAGRTSIDLSGINCTWKRVNGEPEMLTLTIGEAVLDDAKTYRCGTIDYVINQADRYLNFNPENVMNSERLLFDVLVDKVKREKSVKNVTENRLKEIQ